MRKTIVILASSAAVSILALTGLQATAQAHEYRHHVDPLSPRRSSWLQVLPLVLARGPRPPSMRPIMRCDEGTAFALFPSSCPHSARRPEGPQQAHPKRSHGARS